MTAIDRKRQLKCPFWSASSRQCNICNKGLFIPLDDHVEAFCKTFRFSACMQYTLYSEKQNFLPETVRKCEINRRKYLRVESSNELRLVKIFQSGKLMSNFLSEAKTIDMSEGGLRMTLEKPLADEALVQFSFDNTFSEEFQEVTGQIEWCNKLIDKPGYLAGLSFKGDHIRTAMGRYLEQHVHI